LSLRYQVTTCSYLVLVRKELAVRTGLHGQVGEERSAPWVPVG
jgi:hypothetical protein